MVDYMNQVLENIRSGSGGAFAAGLKGDKV
jgi:hypothetical protein